MHIYLLRFLMIVTLALPTFTSLQAQLATDPGIAWAPGSQKARARYLNNQNNPEGPSVSAYRNFPTPRWTNTVTDGGGLGQGDPTTLTWSIIPDGTFIRNGVGEGDGNSGLINFLDGVYHGGGSPGGADLTQRTWWGQMNEVFDRYEELSGLSYIYEANDDGADHIDTPGSAGVRGDVRVGGKPIDGNSGILAYNFGPNSGDMVIDSPDSFFNGNSLRMRNVFAHEHGHGLGQAHVDPTDNTKLQEPFINLGFDGPQFDDILNLQRNYGDVYEKTNGGAGNEVFGNAIALGNIADGSTVEIGADAVGLTNSLLGSGSDTDFISIDDNSDTDYLSFSVNQEALVDLTLTPVGPTYLEGPQNGATSPLNTAQLNDLTLTLFDQDGISVLAMSNVGGLGGAEQILGQQLFAGTYFARITGSDNDVQMYHLNIGANFTVPEPSTMLVSLVALAGLGLRRRRRK